MFIPSIHFLNVDLEEDPIPTSSPRRRPNRSPRRSSTHPHTTSSANLLPVIDRVRLTEPPVEFDAVNVQRPRVSVAVSSAAERRSRLADLPRREADNLAD